MGTDAATQTLGLVELIDQLERLLNESELSEIEVEAGGTALVLRKPIALAVGVGTGPASDSAATSPTASGRANAPVDDGPSPNAVLAPLTGLYYRSPSPGAEPYLKEGGQVMVGQVIGLIEAMKLFNEIKSDASGTVARVLVEAGTLVKRKQPLLEIDPR